MSTVEATSNSTCVSPRNTGPTTHRRRAIDPLTEPENEVRVFHHRELVGSYFYLVEDYMTGLCKFLSSRKNVGRWIMGMLMVMIMLIMFLKISVMVGSNYNDVGMISGGKNSRRLFAIQTWANYSQNIIMSKTEEIKSSLVSSMPQRVPEKYPVSIFLLLFDVGLSILH